MSSSIPTPRSSEHPALPSAAATEAGRCHHLLPALRPVQGCVSGICRVIYHITCGQTTSLQQLVKMSMTTQRLPSSVGCRCWWQRWPW
eukprot:scaffold322606_cov15-Tisochrysis_lutea.AAC.1